MKKLIFITAFFVYTFNAYGQGKNLQLNNKDAKQQRHYWALSGSVFANVPTKSHYLDKGLNCADCTPESLYYHNEVTLTNYSLKISYNYSLKKNKKFFLNIGIVSGIVSYYFNSTYIGWKGWPYFWNGKGAEKGHKVLYIFQPYFNYQVMLSNRISLINQIRLGEQLSFYSSYIDKGNGESQNHLMDNYRYGYQGYFGELVFPIAYKLGVKYKLSKKFYLQAYGLLPCYFPIGRLTNKINGSIIPFIHTSLALSYHLN